jgi:glycosyltransferase involved in cell wall biosynthesis
MQATQNESRWKCIYFFDDELYIVKRFLSSIHLLTLSRFRWTRVLDELVCDAKRMGVTILFDVDDMVFDLDKISVIMNVLNTNEMHIAYDFWFAYSGRLCKAAELADGYVTTNIYLGEMLYHKFGREYGIIPNYLNNEQLKVSEKYRMQKINMISSKPFIVGYFSGTPSHINDFRVIYKELLQLLYDYDDIRLMVVGFMEFPDEMKPLIDKGQVIFTPLVDFLTLQELTALVDVSIVPLVENIFTNCKSELKYFEAAIVGTPTIATPIYTYNNAIRHGENGFLCRQGQWYETIENIYLRKYDMERILENAYYDSIKRYSGQYIIEEINRCYDTFAK